MPRVAQQRTQVYFNAGFSAARCRWASVFWSLLSKRWHPTAALCKIAYSVAISASLLVLKTAKASEKLGFMFP
jgi:hypothetical protein